MIDDPSIIANVDPVPSAQKEKKTEDEKVKNVWPGTLKVANERGYFSGCTSVELDPEQLDIYFQDKPNHLIVHVGSPSAVNGQVHVIWTKTVTDEELAEFTEVQQEARAIIEERKRKRAEAEAQAQLDATKQERETAEAAKKELEELRRLADLGRKHEKNCKKGKK